MTRARTAMMYGLLLAIPLAVYGPVVHFSFVNWDDYDMLTTNPLLRPPTLQSLGQILTRPHLNLYAPLSYATWWLAVKLSGGAFYPWVFHSLNLCLHLAATAMVFTLLRRMVNWPWAAWFGAVLFALHPLQVESVAWVAELNNLLACALSLAALCAHASWSRNPVPSRRIVEIAALGLMLLALYAKPTAVVVPLMAGLIDHYIIRRPIRPTLYGLIPWLVLAAIFSLIARSVQQGPNIPVEQRPFLALHTIAFYLSKVAWPVHLTMDYGDPPDQLWRVGRFALPAAISIALGLAAWVNRHRTPRASVGLMMMIVALLPVLSLTPFDFEKLSTVADRYMYLAMLGPALILTALLSQIPRPIAVGAGVAMAILLGWRTVEQESVWHDTHTLTNYVLQMNPDSAAGNSIRAAELDRASRWRDALPYYRAALSVAAEDPRLHYNYGNALLNSGKYHAAIPEYDTAIHLGLSDESELSAMSNLGLAFFMDGQIDRARGEFTQMLAIDPGNPMATRNLQALEAKMVQPPPASR